MAVPCYIVSSSVISLFVRRASENLSVLSYSCIEATAAPYSRGKLFRVSKDGAQRGQKGVIWPMSVSPTPAILLA